MTRTEKQLLFHRSNESLFPATMRLSGRRLMPLAIRNKVVVPKRTFTVAPPTTTVQSSLFDPTEEHKALRSTVRRFVEFEVEPQAHEYNKKEQFNLPLFQKLGELGLLGITVEEEFGGSGMDATAAVIVHEELSASDPAFCLSYLAHSMLFVNNVARNGNVTIEHIIPPPYSHTSPTLSPLLPPPTRVGSIFILSLLQPYPNRNLNTTKRALTP